MTCSSNYRNIQMHGKLLFLQKAVSLNYLPQQKLSELLKQYGSNIPENIADILVQDKILTAEQVKTICNKIDLEKEVVRLDQTISEDEPVNSHSVIIADENHNHSAIGTDLNISYDDDNENNLIDFSGEGTPLHFTMTEQTTAAENTQDISGDEIPLDITMAEGTNTQDIPGDKIPLDTMTEETTTETNTVHHELTSGITIAISDVDNTEDETSTSDATPDFLSAPLDITMAAEEQVNPLGITLPTAARESSPLDIDDATDSIISANANRVSFHTLSEMERSNISAQLPQAGSSEDRELAQKAVEQKKISVSDLQRCIQEQQKHSQSGNNVSICQLLLEKDVLSPSEVLSLIKEKKTQPAAPTTMGQHFAPGQILADKFRVAEKLGSGGMGAVYKVEHTMMSNRYFALKIMHPNIAANENNYRRFVREVEATMSVMHRNIIPVREFGRLENGSPYLTMDCSTGKPLDEILQKQWSKDIKRSLDITKQILQGLEEAHRKNIVHRDLKPANILVEKDEQNCDVVKIVDFGLAKLVEESEIESITQGAIGTPFYMSPQQAGGEKVDHRTDIYAVGVILYEMTTGSLPFKSNTLRELLKKQMFELPDPPKQIRPDLPDQLELVILKALSKPVEERYQNCAEFISDIDRFLHGKKVEAKKTKRTGNTTLIAAAVVVLSIASALGYLFMAKSPQQNNSNSNNGTQTFENTGTRFSSLQKKIDAYIEQKLWQEARSLLTQTVNMSLSAQEIAKVGAYRQLIERKIQEKSDYQTLNTSVSIARNQRQFDRAIALLKAFQASHPDNVYAKEIQVELQNIENLRQQDAAQQKLQTQYQFNRGKSEVKSLIDQKLWQAAYKALLDLEKLPFPSTEAQNEVANIKTQILQRLDEGREYEKAKLATELQLAKKQYQTALQLWQLYIDKFPQSQYLPQIQQKISHLQELQKDNNKNELQQFIRDAQHALENNNYQQAQDLCIKALKLDAKNQQAMLYLGKTYYYQKSYKNAVRYLTKVSNHNSETYYILARIYNNKSYKKAIFYLEKSIAAATREGSKKNIVSHHALLGQLYEKAKKTPQALTAYKKALRYAEKQRVQKKYLELFRKVGMMLYTQKKLDDAGNYLKTYQNLGGRHPQVSKIIVQFINYAPLNFNSKWKYRTMVNNNSSYNTYIIAAIQNEQYLLKVDGRIGDERWYKKDGYLVKEFRNGTTDKVLKFPPRKGESWVSELPRYKLEYRVISLSESIKVPAGKFANCVKLEVRYSNNSQRYSFIYYAPEVGEVKQEKYLNNQLIFTKELIEYSH